MNNKSDIYRIIKDFWQIRTKSEVLHLTVPSFITIIVGCIFLKLNNINVDRIEFANNYLNSILIVITLFLTFSITYMTIIVTSNNSNINKTKETISKTRKIKENKHSQYTKLNLYQVMLIDITYTIIYGIMILFLTFIQQYIVSINGLEFVIGYNIIFNFAVIVNLLTIVVSIIKNAYFTFWSVKVDKCICKCECKCKSEYKKT